MPYYPFAYAPLPVLYQAILYREDLATIAAPGWANRLDDRLRGVRDAGLYRAIEPYEPFHPITLDEIEAELDHALARILIPPRRNVDERWNPRPPNGTARRWRSWPAAEVLAREDRP